MAGAENVFATELEYHEDGLLKAESLEGMDLDDLQAMLEYVQDAIRVDEKNIEILRKARNAKVAKECEERKVKSFDLENRTYTMFPKTKVDGGLVKEEDPMMWKDITSKRCDLIDISKDNFEDYLKSKGLKPEERKKVLEAVLRQYKEEVRVTKH